MSISKSVLTTALAMLPIASDDQTRWSIGGVLIKVTEVPAAKYPLISFTATDGHMLMTRELRDAECPLGTWMLRQEDATMLKALLKAHKSSADGIDADISADGSLLIGNTTIQRMAIRKPLDKYPDVSAVIPKPHDAPAVISFNAEYLFKLAKAMSADDAGKSGQYQVTISFDPCQPVSPMRVTRGTDQLGVLMPCRIDSAVNAGKEWRERMADMNRFYAQPLKTAKAAQEAVSA